MISSKGRVLSFRGHKRKGYRIIKLQINSNGYSCFSLYDDMGKHTQMVHVLVMRMFVGECPKDKEVNHKDGDKTNNNLYNLEYATRLENIRHAYASGLNTSFGESNGKSVLTDEDVKEIRRRSGTEVHQAIADDYGVSRVQVCRIAGRKQWARVN